MKRSRADDDADESEASFRTTTTTSRTKATNSVPSDSGETDDDDDAHNKKRPFGQRAFEEDQECLGVDQQRTMDWLVEAVRAVEARVEMAATDLSRLCPTARASLRYRLPA